jgi:hypothetical protein
MISSITSSPVMMASVVLGSLSVALLVYAWKSGKSLNPISGGVQSTSPFKFADKFRDRVKNEAQDQDEIPDLAVSQLDNLLSHAVAHGREIERAKGKNSDKLYKMVAITTLVSGLNFIGLLVLIFG